MSDTTVQVQPGEKPVEVQESKQEKTFTQGEVDQLIKDRAERIAKQKYADYDDLKAKAGESKTLEERVAQFEAKYQAAETARLRSDIAAQFQIAAEDRDLFLTGTDEDTLTAQAKRLAERESERKKQGNVAPKEGAARHSGSENSDKLQFVSGLFGDSN